MRLRGKQLDAINAAIKTGNPKAFGDALQKTCEQAAGVGQIEDVRPLTASDILKMANLGERLPVARVLATFADPSNWVQIYDGKSVSEYTPKACEWAFIGPVRPPYELAQNANQL
jgi:hypothetical protein